MNPSDVVNAYKKTGLIPVRKAWQTEDARGGCAIDAVARSLGATNGEAWASEHLQENYIRGFVDAWDSDEPKILDETGNCKDYLIGYWDAIICRDAVASEFSSGVIEHTPIKKAPETT